ncbi:hypothetical protein O6H91_04G046800 [Diphasiastrum complanatum]|nr:hypothetical protein O6H91_04G046800 [Diphasiastrum complanatum]
MSNVPEAIGWELNAFRKVGPRSVNLSSSMDPYKLASAAADLNLKLMRWRLLPSLDLPLLAASKCLLLGAGTLGCQVARGLIAWGVRHITFVDYGRVSMSNPVRQSLYTLDDCLNGGKPKAEAAAENLKKIFPGVHATGVKIGIPMPGHSVGKNEIPKLLEDLNQLKDLVHDHDVVFLLTDTRESRWLPTVLCADANKIAINAALGFDSYLVLRHGACPCPSNKTVGANSIRDEKESKEPDQNLKKQGLRLGCYFCNDVVAPVDSTANRSLDQQCTVTRPGLAPIAAALAVELAIGILHHPDGLYAPADQDIPVTATTDQPLGLLPHQIRGFLAHFAQLMVVGHAFNKCTACSATVVQEYRLQGVDFILKVLNEPNYLEDLTGLTEMLLATQSISLDWDENSEGTDSNPQSP